MFDFVKRILFIFGIIVLFCIPNSMADSLIYKSSEIWSTAASGADRDFISGGTKINSRLNDNGELAVSAYAVSDGYFKSDALSTEGFIEKITVNYQFRGQVRMKVSADNGRTYVDVINGVPVEKGFGNGTLIRWKAQLSPGSSLSKVVLDYRDSSGVETGYGSPELSGSLYRQKIKVKIDEDVELFNHQVFLKIGENSAIQGTDLHCGSKLISGFKELRFTAADGRTLIPHFIERVDGELNKRVAHVWLKIPQLKNNIEINMYFGKEQAEDISSAESVFDFYSDFSSKDSFSNYWSYDSKFEGIKVNNGLLSLKGSIIQSKQVISLKNTIIEWMAAAPEKSEIRLAFLEDNSDAGELEFYSSLIDGFEHCIVMNGAVIKNTPTGLLGKDFNKYRLIFADDISYERYDKNENLFSVVTDSVFKLGNVRMVLKSDFETLNKYQWIRQRKYPDLELQLETVSLGNAVIPFFSNTVLNPKGEIILKSGHSRGTYQITGQTIDFLPHIIVPRFSKVHSDNSAISFDASLDGGKTFLTNGINGTKYYHSQGDFNNGRSLTFRVKFLEASSAPLKMFGLDFLSGKIVLLSPNGGETYGSNDEISIVWSASSYGNDYLFGIAYSTDNETTFNVIENQVYNSGSYTWKVPGLAAENVQIKIYDPADKTIYDSSDAVFSLKKESLKKEFSARNKGDWNSISNWSESDIPSLDDDVVLDKNVTIYAEEEIFFKSIVLGDGKGETETVLIITDKIAPESGNIIIRKGGVLIQKSENELSISGDLIIQNGGRLTHFANNNNARFRLALSATNIIVDQGGLVDADGKGFAGALPEKDGSGPGPGRYQSAGSGSGGSHGGVGYATDPIVRSTSQAYDEEFDPLELGSSGGGGRISSGGSGGGSISLNAVEKVTLSGKISANGVDGGIDPQAKFDGGGGAGGTINIKAAIIDTTADALISVRGGSGHRSGGSGGGGRVNVTANGNLNCIIDINGGKGNHPGGAGSVVSLSPDNK